MPELVETGPRGAHRRSYHYSEVELEQRGFKYITEACINEDANGGWLTVPKYPLLSNTFTATLVQVAPGVFEPNYLVYDHPEWVGKGAKKELIKLLAENRKHRMNRATEALSKLFDDWQREHLENRTAENDERHSDLIFLQEAVLQALKLGTL